MSTTTTIYADTDANLRQNNADNNYSGSGVMRTGQYTGERRHFVMSFDVSAYTNPSDIVSATLKLFYQGSNHAARDMKLVRLNQTFVESEVTWNSASSGVSWSGGAGAEGNGEFTQPAYTIEVGTGSSDPEIDIVELVIDAINRRSGTLWLVLCFDPSDTSTAAGYSLIYPSETGSASNRPQIDVVVADRMVWRGDSQLFKGDLDHAANWSPATVPTSTDIALFSTSDENVTAGQLGCWKIYIGPSYAGTITSTPKFNATELNITSPKSNLSPELSLISGRCEVTVADAKRLTLDGDCNVKIWRTRSEITLASADFGTIDAHSTRATFYADANGPDIKVTGALYRLADGCRTLTAAGSSSGRISAIDNTTMDVVQYGGYIHLLSEEIDDLTMYGGRIKYSGNTGAPIATGDVVVYGGVLDTRVGSPTFGADSITLYAGRLLLDPGQLIDVE
jgi:hypothetical protein